jgi:hypothetical protein
MSEHSSNETGAYLGLRLRFPAAGSLSTFYDRFTSPGLSFSGDELLFDAELFVTRTITLSLRYRRKATEERRAVTAADGLTRMASDPIVKRQGRVTIDYTPTPAIRLRARIDGSFRERSLAGGPERGIGGFQEVVLEPLRQLTASIRVTTFAAASREVGLYEVERDLPGLASMPALIGSGVRWYLLLSYVPSRSVSLSLKYSELTRDDVRHIGSGLDEMPGNRDARLGVQLDASL